MRTEIEGTTVVSILVFIIGFCIGGIVFHRMGERSFRQKMIDYNIGYYNPTNAQFTMKTNFVKIP